MLLFVPVLVLYNGPDELGPVFGENLHCPDREIDIGCPTNQIE